MSSNIAVQGCTLTLGSGSGVVQVTGTPSSTTKAGGSACYSGPLAFSVSGFTGSIITVAGSGAGSGSIPPGALKTKIDSKAAVLEGDSVTVTLTGQAPAGLSTITVTEPVVVKVESAGQTKVKGV